MRLVKSTKWFYWNVIHFYWKLYNPLSFFHYITLIIIIITIVIIIIDTKPTKNKSFIQEACICSPYRAYATEQKLNKKKEKKKRTEQIKEEITEEIETYKHYKIRKNKRELELTET